MQQFLAVLRSFLHSSLLCTFSCHHSPPNYSFILSHLILPFVSWSTSQSYCSQIRILLYMNFWESCFLPFSVHAQTNIIYVGCTKSIGPLVSKNTIIYFDVWNPNFLQSSLLGNAHTSSSGPAIAGNISGKLLVESCTAGPSRSA